MKTGIIILIVVLVLIALYLTRCQCGAQSSEKFCAVAPRFDYYYQATKGYPQGASPFPSGYIPGEGTKCGAQFVSTCNPEKEFKVEFAQDEFMDEEINRAMRGDKTVQARDYEGRMLRDNQPVKSNYQGFCNNRFEGFQNGMEKDVVNGVSVSQFTNIPPPPKIGALSMGPSSLPGNCGNLSPHSEGHTAPHSEGHTAPQCSGYSDLQLCNPLYKINGGPYSLNLAKTGVMNNADTVGSPTDNSCRTCGGEAISTSVKRDIYYQPEMGRLGDNISSGYTYYKAI